MASPTRRLQRISPLITMVRTRRYSISSTSSLVWPRVWSDVSPSVVALMSYFSSPESREIPYSATRGTAIFVDRSLIATSARAVGRVSTVYDSDSCSVIHNCFLARSIAYTNEGKLLRTRPVAVNFEGDVAVLEVEEAEGKLPPPLRVANVFAEKNSSVLAMSRHQNCTVIIVLPIPRQETAVRPKAPWPLEEKLGWVDYGVGNILMRVGLQSEIVGVEYDSASLDVSGCFSVPDISGSPWFNTKQEVVGIASWAAADDGITKSYAVPPSRIRSMIDYAKTKGPHDPIVMDRWINARTIADHKLDIAEEHIPSWPMEVSLHLAV